VKNTNKTLIKMDTTKNTNCTKIEANDKPSITLKAQINFGLLLASYFAIRIIVSLI